MKRYFPILLLALTTVYFVVKFRALQTNTLDNQKTWISLKRNNSLHFFGVASLDDFLTGLHTLFN